MGLLRDGGRVMLMRQDGKCQRIGEREQPVGCLAVLSQVVNDNRGAEQTPNLAEAPPANGDTSPGYAEIRGTPPVSCPGFLHAEFQSVPCRLSFDRSDHCRIDLRRGQRLDRRIRFGRREGALAGDMDPDPRAPSAFDRVPEPACEPSPLDFIQRLGGGPLAGAGNPRRSQREDEKTYLDTGG